MKIEFAPWPPLESVVGQDGFFSDGQTPRNFVFTGSDNDSKHVLVWGFGPVDEAGKQRLVEGESMEDPSLFRDTEGREPQLHTDTHPREGIYLGSNPEKSLKVLEQGLAAYILTQAGFGPKE